MASASTSSDIPGTSMNDQPSTSRKDEEEKEVDQQTQFELLHAIERFLEGGNFGRAAAALRRDINDKKLVPSRTDYQGANHDQNYRQFLSALSHLPSTSRLTADSLPNMISRLSTLSDRAVAPPVKGLKLRLITNKRSALQRTNQVLLPPRRPNLLQDRRGHVAALKTKHSPLEFLRARELGSSVSASLLPGERSIELIERHFRILGHLANVFCVAFDRTENFLITGADDNLVKVWNVDRGMLKFTYRGHSAEIADLAVSYCNQLVASGANDKTVRVWRLQNGETLAVLKQHTAAITSVRFLPFTGNGVMRNLVTTGNDCIVNFYMFNEETLEFPDDPPIARGGLVYHRCERDQPGAKMVSMCHSVGGHVVIIGETHGLIRVYRMHETGYVEKMPDIVAHTDRVDSLMWAHNGMRFCSGSKDGTAKIWRLQYGVWQQTVLSLSQEELILICGVNAIQNNPNSKNRYKVSMVCWTLDDSRIVTTGSEHSFRVWDATNGSQLLKLSLHTDDAFHLCAHPIHAHLILSSGHDGVIAMWDVVRGVVVHKWVNTVEHGEQAAVYDVSLTRDASRFAIVDNKGHVSLYGLGTNKKKVPRVQFFSTDYSPISLDAEGWAMDEATGVITHLMPPPRLINVELEEYPPEIQAMVPGRDLGVPVEEESLVCPWLTRDIVPKLHENELQFWAERMVILSGRESEEYNRELTRERPSSTTTIDAIVPLPMRSNARTARPTSFRAAMMATENAVAQARRSENQRARLSQAQRMAAIRRDVSLRYLGVQPIDEEDNMMPQFDGDMLEAAEEEEEETDTSDTDYESDGERRGRERGDRDRDMMAWQGTASRPRRREREVEEVEVEMDESSQHSRSERRRRRRREEDEFGDDLSIDMYDLPSTSTGRRARGRKEGTQETVVKAERPERSNGRNRRAPRSVEMKEEEMEEEEGTVEERVPRKERTPMRRQPNARDAWKFCFPNWMRDVKRRRFPYVAQVGDHVVYFRQGHDAYLNAVQTTNLYPIDPKMEPKPDIGMEEFAVVEDIKYIIRPYRLTSLKLTRTDAEGRRTGVTWNVKHHDMENVADFIILRSFYEEGLAMGLDVGDEITASIDDLWWAGTVENMSKNETYPNAHWQSVGVRWDSGDDDALSLWDLRRNTDGKRSNQPVSEEEATSMGAVPYVEGDWPEGDDNGDATRRRMKRILERLAECDTAKDFATPVDVNQYYDYPSKVAYPMDLQTICERIENKYYRRLRSLLQDVRHLALSAETYNLKNAPIVRNAKVLVEAICRLANDPSIEDAVTFFDSCFDLSENELVEYKRKQRPEVNSEMLEILREQESSRANGVAGNAPPAPGWIRDAVEILEELMQQPCARHFVSKDENHEELASAWSDPSCDDLQTLVDKVRGGEMATPKEIETAVHHLVSTAKNSMESRRSAIFKDLVALQSQFNNRFKSVLSKFESMQASVQSQIGLPLDRILRRRDREAVPHHAYNTRRSDHTALTAVALAAGAEYDEQQPTSSRNAARHERGFYRTMVNGGGRRASEETEASSSSSRRTTVRRNTRNSSVKVEEEEGAHGSRRSTRNRRTIVDSEEEEDDDDEAAKGLAPPSDEDVKVKQEEKEEEEEDESENGESEEDYEEEEYSPRRANRASSRRVVSKRRAVSTEEEEEEDRESPAASTSTASSTRRSERARKRPRFMSEEEEEDDGRTRGSTKKGRPTRAAARHSHPTYDERSDEEEEEERVVVPSVSQRGRQRKVRSRD